MTERLAYMKYLMCGIAFWACLFAAIWLLRPRSGIYRMTMGSRPQYTVFVSVLTLTAMIAGSSLLMTLCPKFNGEIPEHRDQYERMAESLLHGHLYLEYDDIDPKLLAMEDPYDKKAREELGVNFHWDHAFYKGKYYMYFGVVPVFLLFLPYRVVTGAPLTTYHATQIFIGLSFIGMFVLMRLLARKFFTKMPYVMYLLMAAILPFISTVHCIAKPAMYMTAFAGGICMEIWSLYFFVKAVWDTESENRAILRAFIGAFLGALAFGCRPPIALANLMVIPCLVRFIKTHRVSGKLIGKLAAAATPYLVIGGLLMLYNYLRFDSPFEFGQSYQLTVADQSAYANMLEALDVRKLFNGLIYVFVRSEELKEAFPYVSEGGAFFSYPVFLIGTLSLFGSAVRRRIRENKLGLFVITACLTMAVITFLDVLWSPYLLPRYKNDFMWLLSILVFVAAGHVYGSDREESAVQKDQGDEYAAQQNQGDEYASLICILTVVSMLICAVIFVQLDMEYFTARQIDLILKAARCIRLGLPVVLK